MNIYIKDRTKSFRSKGLINSGWIKGWFSPILRKLRTVPRDMQILDFNEEKTRHRCFSRLFGRKGGNGVNTGGLRSVCFFPGQQRVPAYQVHGTWKKGEMKLLCCPQDRRIVFFREERDPAGRLKGRDVRDESNRNRILKCEKRRRVWIENVRWVNISRELMNIDETLWCK